MMLLLVLENWVLRGHDAWISLEIMMLGLV